MSIEGIEVVREPIGWHKIDRAHLRLRTLPPCTECPCFEAMTDKEHNTITLQCRHLKYCGYALNWRPHDPQDDEPDY